MAKSSSPDPGTLESPQHAHGRKILEEIVALYINTYPDFRPNLVDCNNIAALLYSVSVKHTISPGQQKMLDMLRKKLEAKGILKGDK